MKTSELKNSKMYIVFKCTLQNNYNILQYEIYSHLSLNKTDNEIYNTAQNCKAKCTRCCAIKFMVKLIFLSVLVLLDRRKIKFTSSIKCLSYQWRDSTNFINTNRLCTFCCIFCYTKCFYILLEFLLYFSLKFYLQVKYRLLQNKTNQFYVK